MLGSRIKQARLGRGLSQRDAAKRAGLTATAISKFERGEITPASGTLLRLAEALDVPVEFFFRPETIALGPIGFRKRASLGKKAQARIEADVREQLERFFELLALFPEPPIQKFRIPAACATRIGCLDDVEEVAQEIRDAWHLGRDAVPELADKLEEHGLVVLCTDIPIGQRFDGLATRVDGFPVIVVGRDWPGDRQRFTLAHELGHLVLEGRLTERVALEDACNRFAGAFLAPSASVIAELGRSRRRLEDRELYQLKHEYGLSMFAWIFRARDTGVIAPATAVALMRSFSRRGWRRMEPGDPLAPEKPRLFERLVMRGHAEDMISTTKAAELMAMPLDAFRHRLTLDPTPANAGR